MSTPKHLLLYNKQEEHIIAEALARHIRLLRQFPLLASETEVLTSMMRQIGYRPATEEEMQDER
jgi:hypothetical protein